MPRCFVMQPFDGGVFDKRYDDVLVPAIKGAGLEPYRVDRDPKSAIPIDDIERGIADSEVCLADITLDNPNVWYELGFAIACRKETVLICATARATKFPFDIQHRSIVRYSTDSPTDFSQMGASISERLKAAVAKNSRLESFAKNEIVTNTEGLAPHEIAALAIVMENSLDPDSSPSGFQIRSDMERAGFTAVATGIGLRGLVKKGLLEIVEVPQERGDSYRGYSLTSLGEQWLLANQAMLVLRADRPPSHGPSSRW